MIRFDRLSFRFSLVLAGLLTAAWLLAASASAADTKPITVKLGRKFTLTLASNPTTGYSWTLAKPLDQNFLTLLSNEFVPSKSKLVGAPGAQVWRFKAIRVGETQIALEYVRPWETGVAPVQQTNFIVTITSSKLAK